MRTNVGDIVNDKGSRRALIYGGNKLGDSRKMASGKDISTNEVVGGSVSIVSLRVELVFTLNRL